MFYREMSKGVMYEETVRALKDQAGDHHLAVGYHNQLRTWTQDNGEPLQEIATNIEQVTHCLSCTT
jgi:hypothetical protein